MIKNYYLILMMMIYISVKVKLDLFKDSYYNIKESIVNQLNSMKKRF